MQRFRLMRGLQMFAAAEAWALNNLKAERGLTSRASFKKRSAAVLSGALAGHGVNGNHPALVDTVFVRLTVSGYRAAQRERKRSCLSALGGCIAGQRTRTQRFAA